MKEFLLIRHGQSSMNAGGVYQDETIVPLTDLGQRQAQTTADYLASIPFVPDLIVSSPLKRAKQTAEPLMQKFAETPVEIWPIQEFHQIHPDRMAGLTIDKIIPLFDAHWAKNDPWYRDGDGTESVADLVSRIDRFETELVESSAKRIIAFSHGYFLKTMLIKHALGSGERIINNMPLVGGTMNGVFWIENCGIIGGRIEDNGDIYLKPFSVDHLDEAMRT